MMLAGILLGVFLVAGVALLYVVNKLWTEKGAGDRSIV
jgi:hypothetical protein